MNCSELSIFGMCPFYDQTLLVTCHLCKLIIKLPQLTEHLIKRHNIDESEQTKQLKSNLFENNQKNLQDVKLKSVVEKIKNKLTNSTSFLSNEIKTTSNIIEANLNKNLQVSPTNIPQNLTNQISPNTNHLSPIINNSLINTSKQKINNNKSVRIYDPDKHCGVLAESYDQLSGQTNGNDRCLRSLTCKKHPINLRRQVSGRSKPFNELLKEYKKEKPELKTEGETPKKQRKSIKNCESLPISLVNFNSSNTEQKQDNVLLPQSVFIRNPIYTEPVFPTNGPNPTLDFKPPGQKLNLNNLHLQFVKHHPRPSAVTSYNARLTDGGFTLWNKRQDNLRLILSKTFLETEKLINRNQEFLTPTPTNTNMPIGSSNTAIKRSFPFTSLIKSSSLSQVDSIHKLNDYLIDGDIFQNDDEEDTKKFVKIDKSEKSLTSSLSPSPSSSSSASSSLSHQQFIAQSSKLI